MVAPTTCCPGQTMVSAPVPPVAVAVALPLACPQLASVTVVLMTISVGSVSV